MTFRQLLALALIALGSACGEDDGGPDAGAPVDAGPLPDAGSADTGSDGGVDAGEDAGPGDLGFRPGCGEARFPNGFEDFGAAGPWAVGVASATVAGLSAEIWYPAVPGSEAGLDPETYDLRRSLPESEIGKVPDEANPVLECDCYRDLPLDESWGPYPVIVFVHGTAGFRAQSLPQMTHWASRGFVVIAADHPGLWLQDVLGNACGQGEVPRDEAGDVRRLVGALSELPEPLGFLEGHLDLDRIGMAGHSAGGGAISGMGDLARVLVPLASRGVEGEGATLLESTLIMGGTNDRVVSPSQQEAGFRGSPSPKRLVLLEGAGHLAFSVFCALENDDGQNIVEAAGEAGVCGLGLASLLFDCNPSYLEDEIAWRVVDFATAAAFEAGLQCRDDAEAALSGLQDRFPEEVGRYDEER